MVNETHHPGPIPIERAVKLAGALAESGVATLLLLDGLGIPAESGPPRRLRARETDLPGELVRAGSAWTLRNDDRSLVVVWNQGALSLTQADDRLRALLEVPGSSLLAADRIDREVRRDGRT